MSEAMVAISEWVASVRGDVEILKAVLDRDAVPEAARKLAAGALTYLVSRMDLIPDWTPTIGIIDDVLVLRVCVDLASVHHPVTALEGEARIGFGRLANQVDTIRDLLGSALYARLRKHCERLPDLAVRGHSPSRLVVDESARAALYDDVESELAHLPAATFTDPDQIAVRLRSYLHYKLDAS